MSKKITFIRNLVRTQPEPWFVPRRGGLEEIFKAHPEEAEEQARDGNLEGNDDMEMEGQEVEEVEGEKDFEDENELDADNDDGFDEDLHDERVAFDESHQNEKMQLDRHMKDSRQLFLRKRWVQRIKWGQFLSYTMDNYESLRESARDDALDRLSTYKINQKNKWL